MVYPCPYVQYSGITLVLPEPSVLHPCQLPSVFHPAASTGEGKVD